MGVSRGAITRRDASVRRYQSWMSRAGATSRATSSSELASLPSGYSSAVPRSRPPAHRQSAQTSREEPPSCSPGPRDRCRPAAEPAAGRGKAARGHPQREPAASASLGSSHQTLADAVQLAAGAGQHPLGRVLGCRRCQVQLLLLGLRCTCAAATTSDPQECESGLGGYLRTRTYAPLWTLAPASGLVEATVSASAKETPASNARKRPRAPDVPHFSMSIWPPTLGVQV